MNTPAGNLTHEGGWGERTRATAARSPPARTLAVIFARLLPRARRHLVGARFIAPVSEVVSAAIPTHRNLVGAAPRGCPRPRHAPQPAFGVRGTGASTLQERMNSPLEKREVRLRGPVPDGLEAGPLRRPCAGHPNTGWFGVHGRAPLLRLRARHRRDEGGGEALRSGSGGAGTRRAHPRPLRPRDSSRGFIHPAVIGGRPVSDVERPSTRATCEGRFPAVVAAVSTAGKAG